MPKKTELLKNLKCTPDQADEVMGEIKRMAHDGVTIPESVNLSVCNLVANRQTKIGRPECARAGSHRA